MSRRSNRLSTVDQYFVRVRGFDIWRRVQVPECSDHRLIQFVLNSFGWLGRFGQPGDPVAEGQSVLSLQRFDAPARGGWVTITAPPERILNTHALRCRIVTHSGPRPGAIDGGADPAGSVVNGCHNGADCIRARDRPRGGIETDRRSEIHGIDGRVLPPREIEQGRCPAPQGIDYRGVLRGGIVKQRGPEPKPVNRGLGPAGGVEHGRVAASQGVDGRDGLRRRIEDSRVAEAEWVYDGLGAAIGIEDRGRDGGRAKGRGDRLLVEITPAGTEFGGGGRERVVEERGLGRERSGLCDGHWNEQVAVGEVDLTWPRLGEFLERRSECGGHHGRAATAPTAAAAIRAIAVVVFRSTSSARLTTAA